MGPDTALLLVEQALLQVLGLTLFCAAGYYLTKKSAERKALKKKKSKAENLEEKL